MPNLLLPPPPHAGLIIGFSVLMLTVILSPRSKFHQDSFQFSKFAFIHMSFLSFKIPQFIPPLKCCLVLPLAPSPRPTTLKTTLIWYVLIFKFKIIIYFLMFL